MRGAEKLRWQKRILRWVLMGGVALGFGIGGGLKGWGEVPLVSSVSDPDVSLFISPTKLIQSQSSEVLLNSPEWTEFYLAWIRRLDETYLRKEPLSPLDARLTTIFGKEPASLNDLGNLLFFNVQGIWVDARWSPDSASLWPRVAGIGLVSNFSPDQVAALGGGILEQAGFSPDPSDAGRRVFRGPQPTAWLLQSRVPLPFDAGKGGLFLSSDFLGAGESRPSIFASPDVFLVQEWVQTLLGAQDRVFLMATLGKSGIERLAASLAAQPPEAGLTPYIAGIEELARRTESVWLTGQENAGTTLFTLTIYSRENESAADLFLLFDGLRRLLGAWSEGKTLSAPVVLGFDLFNRAELVCEDERFYFTLKLTEPETFAKIKKTFLYLK